MEHIPGYLLAKSSGLLARNTTLAVEALSECRMCPRNCGVNRINGETGVCRTKDKAMVSSYMPHFGEEPPLSGTRGSGTIFFSRCNLGCCFCQNYDISITGEGEEAESWQIAAVFLDLRQRGCHNINLVTPSHVVAQVLQALDIAIDNGLDIPIVYNSSGYDSVETLKLLDGIVDIYMPDFKFWDPKVAKMLCRAEDYPKAARKAIAEMHRQTGDLKTDENGIAVSGLLVRHLVLPENLSGTKEVMSFLKNRISENTHVNIMSQYRPAGDAKKIPAISRAVTVDEYKQALETARDAGLNIIR